MSKCFSVFTLEALTPSWQNIALKPKPYSGWPWIQLGPQNEQMPNLDGQGLT